MFKKILVFIIMVVFLESFNLTQHLDNIYAKHKVVYLTFDDGPSHNTKQILDILNEYKIKATFFIVGNNIKKEKNGRELLKEIIKDNHYIGLHTMTHNYQKLYGKENTFINEILEEKKIIYNITGKNSRLIRAPYNGTLITNKYLTEITKYKFKLWDWTVDTRDWCSQSTHEILLNIDHDIEHSNPNLVVILFHEFDMTVKALPEVIEHLTKEGYTFKTYNPNHHIPVNFKHNPNI